MNQDKKIAEPFFFRTIKKHNPCTRDTRGRIKIIDFWSEIVDFLKNQIN